MVNQIMKKNYAVNWIEFVSNIKWYGGQFRYSFVTSIFGISITHIGWPIRGKNWRSPELALSIVGNSDKEHVSDIWRISLKKYYEYLMTLLYRLVL